MALVNLTFWLYAILSLRQHGWFHNLVVLVIYGMQQFIHARTIISDPGLAAKETIEFEDPLTPEQAK